MTTGEVEKKLKSIKKLDKAIHNLDLKISNLEKGRYTHKRILNNG